MALVGLAALAAMWLAVAAVVLRSGLRASRRVRDRRWDRAMSTLRGCQGAGLGGPVTAGTWCRPLGTAPVADVPAQREPLPSTVAG